MLELSLGPEIAGPATVGFAGDAANTAIYLKRAAPAAEVAFVTAVGDDAASQRMVEFLGRHGLSTDLIERRAGMSPGLYAITLDAQGERSFSYWRDASAARTLFRPPCALAPEALAGFDLVYLSGITLAVLAPEARAALGAFLGAFRARGGRVAFDSNYRPRLWPDADTARREMAALWRLADIGLPSLDDEIALWGDAEPEAVIARLAGLGVADGALKRGAEGPLPIGWQGALPAFPRVRPVDTTAAGDSFNGGWLAALVAGAAPPERLAAGHALASRVVQHQGAIIPG